MKIFLVYLLLLHVAIINTKYIQNKQGVDLTSVGPNVRPLVRMTPSATPSFTFETKATKGKHLVRGWMVKTYPLHSRYIYYILLYLGVFCFRKLIEEYGGTRIILARAFETQSGENEDEESSFVSS